MFAIHYYTGAQQFILLDFFGSHYAVLKRVSLEILGAVGKCLEPVLLGKTNCLSDFVREYLTGVRPTPNYFVIFNQVPANYEALGTNQ